MNPASLLPAGVSPDLLVEILVGLANVVAVAILFRAFSPKEAVNARAQAHAKRRRELRGDLLTQTRRSTQQRRPVTAMRGLLERLKLTRGEEVRKASETLAKAGWRTPDSLTIFLGVRLCGPPILGVFGFFFTPLLVHQPSTLILCLGALVGAFAGAYAPNLVVNNAAKKRQTAIQKQLPDCLDLFVICAEAGLGLEATFARVAREIAPNGAELADELGLTTIELGFLPNRQDALANLAKRVDLPSVRSLVNTLGQSERYGTPLAQSMRVLADEFRNERLMRAETKAARLPATLTIPMMVFILPPLFVVLIGPAAVQIVAALQKK
jgi:tight adherence protein C